MGRLRGIQKPKKRRRRRHPQQINLAVEEIRNPAHSNAPNSQNKTAVPNGNTVLDENHDSPLQQTSSVGSRSAGLQEVVGDILSPNDGSRSAGLQDVAEDSMFTRDVGYPSNFHMSDTNEFSTPRKLTDNATSPLPRKHHPHSSHVSNDAEECNSSDDNISSCFDRREYSVSDEGSGFPRRSLRISNQSGSSKTKLINRVPKLSAKQKYSTKRRQYDSVGRNDSFLNSINDDANRNIPLSSSPNFTPHNQEYPIDTSNTNINDSINIVGINVLSPDTNRQELETNSGILNKTNLSTSYSSRRRYVRNLKHYIFSLGSLDIQAIVLSDLLNDSEMKPVITAAGVTSPAEANFNDKVVNQVLKQIDRSSAKDSSRGRVNNDKQSYKINMTAALMKSPNSNAELSVLDKTFVNMLFSKTCLSRSSARRLVIKAKQRRMILTNAEKDTTWSIVSHRQKYNTQQNSINLALFEWIVNHPHVISSPIHRDTVLVNVHRPNGDVVKERVGKLLLEISIRELHQDMMKPPPTGLHQVYCKVTKKCIISESYLRNIIPPQLRPITFSQKQLCGCETCTLMKLIHTSLIKYRNNFIQSYTSRARPSTRSTCNDSDTIASYCVFLKSNESLLSKDVSSTIQSMTCPSVVDSGLLNWNWVLNRCKLCPNHVTPIHGSNPFSSLETYNIALTNSKPSVSYMDCYLPLLHSV